MGRFLDHHLPSFRLPDGIGFFWFACSQAGQHEHNGAEPVYDWMKW
jgi:hypothetical protein